MLRLFIVFQLLTPLLVAVACPRDGYSTAIVEGLQGTQATLVSFWIAFGTARFSMKLLTALAALGWFTSVLQLRPYFNSWIVVLLGFQLAVTSLFLLRFRRLRGYLLTTVAPVEEGLPWQFRIRHLLILMLAIPLVWGIFPLFESLPFLVVGRFVLYLFVLLVAVGYSAGPLIVGWAVFARGKARWRAAAATIGALMAASVMAYVSYSQTGSIARAVMAFLWSATSSLFAALSFAWLKRIGYRVARLPEHVQEQLQREPCPPEETPEK